MAKQFPAIVITNNPYLRSCEGVEVRFREASAFTIIEEAKELVYQGCKLLTHPLSGNWEINAPYKSLLLEKREGTIDSNSIFVLEQSIRWLQNLPASKRKPEEWPDRVRHDFQLIDRDIFDNALRKHRFTLDTL